MAKFTHAVFDQLVKEVMPTGSRFICNPPVENTDEDYVLLVSNLPDFIDLATIAGWSNNLEEYDGVGSEFECFRKDEYNLIVTSSKELFDKWCTATMLAKFFNLTKKTDRVELFSVIVDGNTEWTRTPATNHYIDKVKGLL